MGVESPEKCPRWGGSGACVTRQSQGRDGHLPSSGPPKLPSATCHTRWGGQSRPPHWATTDFCGHSGDRLSPFAQTEGCSGTRAFSAKSRNILGKLGCLVTPHSSVGLGGSAGELGPPSDLTCLEGGWSHPHRMAPILPALWNAGKGVLGATTPEPGRSEVGDLH